MAVRPTLARTISTLRLRRPGVLDVYFGRGEADPAIECEFFASLRLPNGTAKTSRDHRLDDLNALVTSLLPTDRPIAAMDVAVGSGISSLEWLDQLRAAGHEPQLLAGDLYAWGWLTTYGRNCAVLYLEDGTPVTLEMYGRTVNLQSDRRVVRGLRQGIEALFELQAQGAPAACLEPPRRGRRIHRRIPIVSPRLIGRAEPEVISDDLAVGGRFSQRFHIVRAANIVNRAYFDQPTLSLFLSNLVDRVKEGGLLAVCRTSSDGTNHATVFRRTRGVMAVEARLGPGSEVEDLVLLAGCGLGS